jgi:hypothetical protein
MYVVVEVVVGFAHNCGIFSVVSLISVVSISFTGI